MPQSIGAPRVACGFPQSGRKSRATASRRIRGIMPCRPRIKYKGQHEPHWIVAKPAIPPYQAQPPMNLHASLQESAAWFELLDPDQQARVVSDTTIAVAEPGNIIEHRGGGGPAWTGVLSGLGAVPRP